MKAYLLTKEELATLRASWGAMHAARNLTAEDLALYAILRGRNPERGFACPRGLSYSPRFFPTLNELKCFDATWQKLLKLLPAASAERLGELFAATTDAINQRQHSK